MNDDLDSIDHSNSNDARPSKRDRFKGAISRTRNKIDKLKEDREAKKQTGERKSDIFQLSDDVNDFLSAGRPSTASDRPSTGSTVSAEGDSSSIPTVHSVPFIQYPQLAHPPRRKPVPKIDVSVPSRFSGGQLAPEGSHTGDDTLKPGGAGYLNPDFRPRSSQSSVSHGISEERRARIRGLSVGFADISPVVIGEGGDECEMPVTEISRIKARARSESPGRRRPYPGTTAGLADTRLTLRASDDSEALRSPLPRLPTGYSNRNETLEPRLAQRASDRPAMTHQMSNNDSTLAHVKRTELAGQELQKEFEMTLGLPPSFVPSGAGSAGSHGPVQNPPMQIVAPKPVHPPPSYQVIENGSLDGSVSDSAGLHLQSQLQDRVSPAQPPRRLPPQSQSAYQRPRFRDPEQRASSTDTRAQYFASTSASQHTDQFPPVQQQIVHPQIAVQPNQSDQLTPFPHMPPQLQIPQAAEWPAKPHLRRRSPTGPERNERPTSRDGANPLASSSNNDNDGLSSGAELGFHSTPVQGSRLTPHDAATLGSLHPSPSRAIAGSTPPTLPPRPQQARQTQPLSFPRGQSSDQKTPPANTIRQVPPESFHHDIRQQQHTLHPPSPNKGGEQRFREQIGDGFV